MLWLNECCHAQCLRVRVRYVISTARCSDRVIAQSVASVCAERAICHGCRAVKAEQRNGACLCTQCRYLDVIEDYCVVAERLRCCLPGERQRLRNRRRKESVRRCQLPGEEIWRGWKEQPGCAASRVNVSFDFINKTLATVQRLPQGSPDTRSEERRSYWQYLVKIVESNNDTREVCKSVCRIHDQATHSSHHLRNPFGVLARKLRHGQGPSRCRDERIIARLFLEGGPRVSKRAKFKAIDRQLTVREWECRQSETPNESRPRGTSAPAHASGYQNVVMSQLL